MSARDAFSIGLEAGWQHAWIALVACDFIDDQELQEGWREYVAARLKEEQEEAAAQDAPPAEEPHQ